MKPNLQLDDRDLIRSRVYNPLPLTWPWLAGFYQAEGSVSLYTAQSSGQLEISQKDREILDRIREDLGFGSVYTNTVGFHRFSCSGWANIGTVIDGIIPCLVGKKRDNALRVCDQAAIPVVNNLREVIIWDFLTGFWEGDGSLAETGRYNKSPTYQVCFHQKDPEILHMIKDFLGGKANVRSHGSKMHLLCVRDIREELLRYCRTFTRRVQLVSSLAGSEKL